MKGKCKCPSFLLKGTSMLAFREIQVSTAPSACSATAQLAHRAQRGCLHHHSAEHSFSQLAGGKMCWKAGIKISIQRAQGK